MGASDRHIIAGNADFYRAFSARDYQGMTRLWSSSAPVSCIHPGWGMLIGIEAVMKSWREVLANPQSPAVECRQARDFVDGAWGYVLCHEVLDEGVLMATNIFRRENRRWRMVHHQSGPVAMPPAAPPAGGVIH